MLECKRLGGAVSVAVNLQETVGSRESTKWRRGKLVREHFL